MENYDWIPPCLSEIEVEEFFSHFPSDQVPLEQLGINNRKKYLFHQIPKSDLAIEFNRFIKNDSTKKSFCDFLSNQSLLTFGVALCMKNSHKNLQCNQCHLQILTGTVYVQAMDNRNMLFNYKNFVFHPNCFKCSTCDHFLSDLAYCMHNTKLYCVRHYGDLFKPRCGICDELIYNDQATKAMSQTIHPEHFACWNCDNSLTGSRYILRDDHPYCIRCYEDLFANECEECRKKIGTDSKDLSYKDKHWHEKCFFCHVCKLPLVDKPFGNKDDSLYCSECYNQAFASRCDKCAQIFKPGMKKMEYKGQQFHETCFLCYSCDTAIGTKSFIPKENRIYCVPCYENNFATKCTECMKVISQGGVSYKNQPYHKECFVCTHCQQSLAGQRFTSREDHPYCSECFGKLFAKKCFACHKPITGIGGTKYISFEDRHWHNDCFMCNRCNSSLVGRGFLTDAMDILCPDCGKNEP